MFFGTIVRPGKPAPLVPHADGHVLHLSQAALSADAPAKSRVSLLVKLGDNEEPVVLCTLCAGVQDTVPLDQYLSQYAELTVLGSAPVHLTGYYSPEFGPEGDEDDDEEDEEQDADYAPAGRGADLQALLDAGVLQGYDGSSDEDEDGYDSDDGPLDGVASSSDEGESDDDDDDSSDDDEGPAGHRREPSVIIEDITDQEHTKKGAAANGATPQQQDGRKRKALPAPEANGAAPPKKQAVDAAGKQQQQQKTPKQQQQTPKQQQQQTPKQQQQTPKQQQAAAATAKTPDSSKAAAAAAAAAPTPGKKGAVKRYDNGFEVHNLAMGDPHGKLAKGGKVVKVRYEGRLKSNGRVFDATKHKPFAFRLGVGEVIKGWDRGVEGMRVGDKRKLVIPPQMAYGSQKTGPIPPNSWLEFTVELVDVK